MPKPNFFSETKTNDNNEQTTKKSSKKRQKELEEKAKKLGAFKAGYICEEDMETIAKHLPDDFFKIGEGFPTSDRMFDVLMPFLHSLAQCLNQHKPEGIEDYTTLSLFRLYQKKYQELDSEEQSKFNKTARDIVSKVIMKGDLEGRAPHMWEKIWIISKLLAKYFDISIHIFRVRNGDNEPIDETIISEEKTHVIRREDKSQKEEEADYSDNKMMHMICRNTTFAPLLKLHPMKLEFSTENSSEGLCMVM